MSTQVNRVKIAHFITLAFLSMALIFPIAAEAGRAIIVTTINITIMIIIYMVMEVMGVTDITENPDTITIVIPSAITIANLIPIMRLPIAAITMKLFQVIFT